MRHVQPEKINSKYYYDHVNLEFCVQKVNKLEIK